MLLLLSSGDMARSATTEDLTKIGMGARPIGMGRAFVAVANDSNSIFTNPSGLSNLKSWEITSMYTSFFEGDLNYVVLGMTKPFSFGTFGVGLISTGTGQILSPNPSGGTFFDYYDRMLILSFSENHPFKLKDSNIYLGLNLKYFQKGFSGSVTSNGKGVNADIGIKIIPKSDLSFGFLLQNFLPTSIVYDTGSSDDIASYLKAGISKHFFGKKITFAFDVDVPLKRSTLIPITFHSGLEYNANKNLCLRLGIDQDISASSQTSTSLAAGVGLKIKTFSFDYAYKPFSESGLSATHFISVTIKGVEN